MNTHYAYVPIVKGKRNDIEAVSMLTNDVRGLVKPLVEVMPIDRKKFTVETHIEKFANYIIKFLPHGEIFVDFYGLLPDEKLKNGSNAIISGFSHLKERGCVVTPTYGLDRNDKLWAQLKSVVSDFNQGFCFRISIDDLDDKAEETWDQIIERTSDMALFPPQVDIVVDLRFVGDKNENDLKNMVIDFLALNSNASKYRSVTLAGSSALKTVSEIEKDNVGEVSRKELRLWSALSRDVDESLHLLFGDYGVIHPDFSDQGSSKYTNAKIRYTVGSRILYFRGHGLTHPKKDYVQYHDLAAKVCADNRYQGASSSYGDSYMFECANRMIKPGSPSTWVRADMNHHISYTAKQTKRLMATFSREPSDQIAEAALNAI